MGNQLWGARILTRLSKARRAACFSPYMDFLTFQYTYLPGSTREYKFYWVHISLGTQRKNILIFLKRSVDEQRRQSFISAQINWEPGFLMKLLKSISLPIGLQQENLILRCKEACNHRCLVLCDRGRLCANDNHIVDFHP